MMHEWFTLHADGGNRGDRNGRAAIGAVLSDARTGTVVAPPLSREIAPATHNAAEYHALIAGLTLALDHGVRHVRVFMDSALVVDQVNGDAAVRQPDLAALHADATALKQRFASFRIAWVPRRMNAEADRLVNDALAGLTS